MSLINNLSHVIKEGHLDTKRELIGVMFPEKFDFDGKSEPPEAKPYVTFETGIIVRPSGRLMGSPMIVLTSTKSLTFSIVVLRIPFADFSIMETPSLSIKIIYFFL